jgi:hypothetical protein
MKIIICILCLTIAGCTWTRTFDPVEYNHLNDLVTIADLNEGKCRTPEGQKELVQMLSNKMAYIMNYVKHSYANAYAYSTLIEVDKNISEFAMRVATGKASVNYCKVKLQLISITTGEIQYTLGNMR